MASNINPSLTPVNSLTNFKFWCQKVLPLVYDDSLSYYEVLGKMVVQLNDVIDNVNADTENVLTLKDAFLELQTYVNNFFDDIDQLASYAERAEAAQTAANTSAVNAATSASNASASSLAAMDARNTAVTAKQAAETSANTASTAATNANTKANEAAQSAITAQTAQASASQSATLAATDRSAAQTAASTATTKANEASTSASNAETSAENAAQSEANAEGLVNNIQENLDNIQQNTQDISDLKESFTQIYDVEIGENICDPSTITTGALKSDGSVDATATAYSVSDFIEIKANTIYTFTEFRQADGTASTSRKYCALYDENKTFVSGSYQNVNPSSGLTIQTGNAKYLRVANSKPNDKFVKEGSTFPSAFVAYKKTLVSKLKNPKNSIERNELAFNTVDSELINLYTGVGDTVGIITYGGGLDPTGTNYKTTAPMPIRSGVSYTISPRLRIYALYSNITADSTSKIYVDNQEKAEPYTFVSDVDGYLRVTYNINYPLTSVISSFNNTVTEKIEEGIALSDTQVKQVLDVSQATNILYGKKWAVCGDSFTHSGGTGTLLQDGKYKGEHYTYPWIIGNRQNMDIVKFFEGGRTLAFPAEPDTFTNSLTNPNAEWYYQNIPLDADYITIYLGINDEHHSSESGGGDGEDNTGIIPLGTISDTTTATYYGAWNVVLSWLITNRPNAHIGIIVTNGIANNDNYRLAQIAIAQKYGIPYIDMNGDVRTPAMLRTSNPNIDATVKQALIEKWSVNYPSNEHPNDAAQEFESTFIENFLRSI